MSYTLEFRIDGLPKTGNVLLGAPWKVRAGHAKVWERKVFKECWHLRPPEPLKKAKLTFTRYSSRTPDFDGLVSSFKAVKDALVKLGFIVDDNPKVVGQPTYVHEVVSPLRGAVKVKIEEIVE